MIAAVVAAAAVPLIVGDWAYGPATPTVEACETDNGVRYSADRRFASLAGDVRGTWQLDGRTLTEQVTHRRDTGARERRVWPKPTRSTLRWPSLNALTITDAAGKMQTLRRCRIAP